jgi:hypothetical protein
MQGFKHLVNDPVHRKELVAGNLGEYISTRMYTCFASQPRFDVSRSEFCESAERVGDDAGDFYELHRADSFKDTFNIWSLLREPMNELPQVLRFDSKID